MKILHTSDWHLGQTWSGRPRKKEFEAFLDWMFQTLRERAVDVLIVAGDVFDISSPATETQKMYFQFLKKVSTVCPNTIITAGNHDSPHLLDVPKPFLNEFGIHVVGVASGPEDELVVLGNGNDDTNSPPRLIVAAVPFLRDREIRRAVEGESFEESENRTIAGIKAHYGTVCAAAEEIRSRYPGQKIPLIATGHLFVAGIETPGAVREIHVGTLGRLGCDVFPDGIDYVALGHIHRPSAVGGRETIRYSGSPIPMSFEEESLRYYEDYFQTEIFRLPHPSIYGFWADGTFMSPETIPVIDLSLESGHIFDMRYSDASDWIRDAMPEMVQAYQASGVRSADSQVRGTSIRKNGSVNHNKKTFFPVYDYKKEDMIRELTAAKIKLPVDYKWFGNTFDGIDYRFTEPLSRFSPADFEQVKRAYPLVEADIMRMKYREEYYHENS